MIYFDAHVHIHQHFPLEQFLNNGIQNLIRQRWERESSGNDSFVLMLTESKDADVFSKLYAEAKSQGRLLSDSWSIELTQETESLLLRHKNWVDCPLYIFAGRQIVAKERLEVLALGTDAKIADGLSINEAIEAVHSHHGLAVLPWGAGKWLGGRGTIIDRLIDEYDSGSIFVGDNGGRPFFWTAPKQFAAAAKKEIALLPGSDPLPLTREEERVGTYGGYVQGTLSDATPGADFRKLLQIEKAKVHPFGSRMHSLQFFKLQIGLRL